MSGRRNFQAAHLGTIVLLLAVVWPQVICAEALATNTAAVTGPTWCRFVPERKDDFAWENDLMAFRAYGPAIRGGVEDSGIDCWVKRGAQPVIEKWYAVEKEGRSYHDYNAEGYDPYHVGASLGCGGSALWSDGSMITAGPYRSWNIIERTPFRSVFELTYEYPVRAGEVAIREIKRITVEAGSPLLKIRSSFSRYGKPLPDLPVALGVTTHDGLALATLRPEDRWVSCWEVIDGAGLGTGLILDPGYPLNAREIKSGQKDKSHAVILSKTGPTGSITYRVGFAWTASGRVTTTSDWEKILSDFSSTLPPKKP